MKKNERKVFLSRLTFVFKNGKIFVAGCTDRNLERMNRMDLSQKSVENVEYMIEKIKEKLKVLNFGAIKPSHFDEEMYEELKDIYDLVMKKPTFSPNEMQAIVEELGSLKK
jgi:uncharacterized protein YfkK (UPF0435 family)